MGENVILMRSFLITIYMTVFITSHCCYGNEHSNFTTILENLNNSTTQGLEVMPSSRIRSMFSTSSSSSSSSPTSSSSFPTSQTIEQLASRLDSIGRRVEQAAQSASHSPTASSDVQVLHLQEDDSLEEEGRSANSVVRRVSPEVALRSYQNRRRLQQHRMLGFRQSILRATGRGQPINLGRDPIAALNQIDQLYPSMLSHRATQRHCYLSNCTLPTSINTELWSNETDKSMRLFFSVPRINRRNDKKVDLQTARLKLYIKPKTECHCPNDTTSNRTWRIQITVHQFLRPLAYRGRKNRVLKRRELLDSISVTNTGNAWVALDIKDAAKVWMNRARKNYGLEVTVRDMNGTELDAQDVIPMPRCLSFPERSCRADHNQRIEQVLWPSLSPEEMEPYLDVVTIDQAPTYTYNTTRYPLFQQLLRRPRSIRSARSWLKPSPSTRMTTRDSQQLLAMLLTKRRAHANSKRPMRLQLKSPFYRQKYNRKPVNVQPKSMEYKQPVTSSKSCNCNTPKKLGDPHSHPSE